VNAFQRNASRELQIAQIEGQPIVRSTKIDWMGPLQAAYEQLRAVFPDVTHASIWDDDMILSKRLERELRGHLQDFRYDRVMAQSWFLWDDGDHVNMNFPPHWSTIVWRIAAGDRMPTTFVHQATERVAQSNNYLRLDNPLLNYGYMRAEDRPLIWETARKAGRIDAHTLTLVKPPKLWKLHD
jgi:hypothetical protein